MAVRDWLLEPIIPIKAQPLVPALNNAKHSIAKQRKSKVSKHLGNASSRIELVVFCV